MATITLFDMVLQTVVHLPVEETIVHLIGIATELDQLRLRIEHSIDYVSLDGMLSSPDIGLKTLLLPVQAVLKKRINTWQDVVARYGGDPKIPAFVFRLLPVVLAALQDRSLLKTDVAALDRFQFTKQQLLSFFPHPNDALRSELDWPVVNMRADLLMFMNDIENQVALYYGKPVKRGRQMLACLNGFQGVYVMLNLSDFRCFVGHVWSRSDGFGTRIVDVLLNSDTRQHQPALYQALAQHPADKWDVRLTQLIAKVPAATPAQWKEMAPVADALVRLWTGALVAFEPEGYVVSPAATACVTDNTTTPVKGWGEFFLPEVYQEMVSVGQEIQRLRKAGRKEAWTFANPSPSSIETTAANANVTDDLASDISVGYWYGKDVAHPVEKRLSALFQTVHLNRLPGTYVP